MKRIAGEISPIFTKETSCNDIKPHHKRFFFFSIQNVGLKSMKICVKDLLGSGSGHDRLTVTYTVIGGWFSLFFSNWNQFSEFSEKCKVSFFAKH